MRMMSDSWTAATQETVASRCRGSGGQSGFVFPTWTIGRTDSTSDGASHRSQPPADTGAADAQQANSRNPPSSRQQGDWQSGVLEKPEAGRQGHQSVDRHSRAALGRPDPRDNRSHGSESSTPNQSQEELGNNRTGKGRYSAGDSEQASAYDRSSVAAEQQQQPQPKPQKQQGPPPSQQHAAPAAQQQQPNPSASTAVGRQYSQSPRQTPVKPSPTPQQQPQQHQQTQHNFYPQQAQPMVQQQPQPPQPLQSAQLGPNMIPPYQQPIQPSQMQPQVGMQSTQMMPTPGMMSPSFASKSHMMPPPLGYQPRRQVRQLAGFNLPSTVPEFDDPVTENEDLFGLPPPNFSSVDREWPTGEVEDSGWRPRRPSSKWEAEGLDSGDWPYPMLRFPGMMGDDRLTSKRASNWGMMPQQQQPRSWGDISTAPSQNLLSLDDPDFDGGDSFNFGTSFMAGGAGRTGFNMNGLDPPSSVAGRPFMWGDGVPGVGSGGRGGGNARRSSFVSSPAWFPSRMSHFNQRGGQYDFM